MIFKMGNVAVSFTADDIRLPLSQTYPAMVMPSPCESFFNSTVKFSSSGKRADAPAAAAAAANPPTANWTVSPTSICTDSVVENVKWLPLKLITGSPCQIKIKIKSASLSHHNYYYIKCYSIHIKYYSIQFFIHLI